MRDHDYLRWLHCGIPCVACLIEQLPPSPTSALEAAHQKLGISSRGWHEGGSGVRVSDDRCVVLCRWHHRLAPNACDNGQRAFWDRLGVGDRVADLCAELYAAYQAGQSGGAVVRGFIA